MARMFLVLAGLAVSAAVPQAASAAGISVVGNHFEAYGETTCNNLEPTCTVTFPANGTGKVVRIENVTCQAVGFNSGALLRATVGPVASPGGPFLKQSWFPQRNTAANGTFPIHTFASYPGLLLGANRYLQVVVTSGNSFIAAECSASGVFTP